MSQVNRDKYEHSRFSGTCPTCYQPFLAEENERLKLEIDILNSALHPQRLPCGHPGQYGYTEDGGKHIVCLVCVKEDLDKPMRSLEEQDKRTRHVCAEAIIQLAASVVAANTYRGKVNVGAEFAVELLNRAVALCMNVEAVKP